MIEFIVIKDAKLINNLKDKIQLGNFSVNINVDLKDMNVIIVLYQ